MADLKQNNEFDSLEAFFNRSLKNASAEPADNTWMHIEEELNRLEKEKRRRRFLWFFSSGLILLCGLSIALWYFMMNDRHSLENTTAAKETKKEISQPAIENTAIESIPQEKIENTESKNVPGENAVAEKTEQSAGKVMIQLGAFKHGVNTATFNKLPYKVIEVNSNDGYTRYFAEAPDDKALEKIQQLGFAGAFVKKDLSENNSSHVVKNEEVIEPETSAAIAMNTYNNNSSGLKTGGGLATSNNKSEEKQTETKTEPVALTSENINKKIPPTEKENDQSATKAQEEPAIAGANDKNEQPGKTEPSSTPTNLTSINPQSNVGNETKTNEASEQPIGQSPPAADLEIKKDSTAFPPVAAETKPDSIPAKKDSVATPVAKIDTAKKLPFKPEWALYFTGGPNIFSSAPQSTSYASNESSQTTYNGEAKLQYRPFKYLSFSGGVNYTSFTEKQDEKQIFFNKFQQNDYVFNSAFGPMLVPMSTMLQGFYFNFPSDTFPCKYKYNATVQSLNIPIEANVHFLDTKYLNLFLGLGANTSIALAQRNNFSIIKENSTIDLSYNNVNVNRVSIMLLMSLGCDVRITKHWYFTLMPSYTYGLTNMSKTSGTLYKPAYFSGNAGIKFKF